MQALEAEMRRMGLVNVVGVGYGLRLAAHGLFKVWDMDAMILAYREEELTSRMGLNQREAREVVGRLFAWTQQRFHHHLRDTHANRSPL